MNFYVLAGGKSSRLGQNKALLKVGNKTIIEKIIGEIPSSAQGVKIVTNTPDVFTFLALPIIRDIYPGRGPISGVHAGLLDSESFFSFFLACDLPRISRVLIEDIIAQHSGEDIFGPMSRGGFEPLCTIYSKSCIPLFENSLREGRYSLQAIFEATPTARAIEVADQEALFNLNTAKDWELLQRGSERAPTK